MIKQNGCGAAVHSADQQPLISTHNNKTAAMLREQRLRSTQRILKRQHVPKRQYTHVLLEGATEGLLPLGCRHTCFELCSERKGEKYTVDLIIAV